jgi:glycosyltransferase involved in cell wall biosynthesis
VKLVALVPTYDNPRTVRGVVERIRARGLDVLVVDDGSGPDGRAACEAIAADGLATVLHRPENGGKGAACKHGFRKARELGYSHAFQIDADGQHDLDRIEAFAEAARSNPDALILGYPEYDATAPRSRRIARGLTDFWVAVEVGGRGKIRDAMIGFRIYPLAVVAELEHVGDRMDFDIEVAVEAVRRGAPTVNLPVAVRYLSVDEGGVSHFHPLRDNLRFAWLHSKLCTLGCMRWTFRRLWPFGRGRRAEVAR